MAKPTSGESLILSGDEDNYLTSLVVKVPPAPPRSPGPLVYSSCMLSFCSIPFGPLSDHYDGHCPTR